MRLWFLLMGLLILVLIAPVYAGVAGDVVGSYSDPVSQMIIYLMLPALAILFIFVGLFFDDEGDGKFWRG